jgi:hypothetical protein
MRTFGIVVNPLASTAALSQFNRTRNRHLNALELSAFLRRLDGLSPGRKKTRLLSVLISVASVPPSCYGPARPTWISRAAPSLSMTLKAHALSPVSTCSR